MGKSRANKSSVIPKCKDAYRAVVDDNGKLVNNVANYGLRAFEESFVRRNGEYHGLTVEAQEDISPIITNHRISKALDNVKNEDFESAAKTLCIYKWYVKYGNNSIFYTINKWYEQNKLDLPYKIKAKIKDKELDNHIDTDRRSTLKGRLKITSVGMNTKTKEPVVPESWLNREFESGQAIHSAIDKLPHRKNKPKVHFCCIYSMSKIDKNTWIDAKKYGTKAKSKNDRIISIEITKGKVVSDITTKFNYKNRDGKYFKVMDELIIYMGNGIMKEPEYIKTSDSVSYLASRLQKCFRRYEGVDNILIDTMNKLNSSPCYNLPDQQFVKVSGTRQLLWRTFISMIEDVYGYVGHEIDMFTLSVLALITHLDPNLQLTKTIMKKIIDLGLRLVRIDRCWNWRDYSDKVTIKYQKNMKKDSKRIMLNSIYLSLKCMPMMTNDKHMLKKAYDLIEKNNIYPSLNKNKLIENSDPYTEEHIKMVAFDMHCYPAILIELQGTLNFIPTEEYTLPKLSSFIWRYSSSYNDRKNYHVAHGIDIEVLDRLIDIQYHYKVKQCKDFPFDFINKNTAPESDSTDYGESAIKRKEYIDRVVFLLLFGSKFRMGYLNKDNPACEIIIAGDEDNPIKVKRHNKSVYEYMEGKDRDRAVKRFVNNFTTQTIKLPQCIEGYKWNFGKKNKKNNYVDIDIFYDKKNRLNFSVNNKNMLVFNGSSIVTKIKKGIPNSKDIPLEFKTLLSDAFYWNKTKKNILLVLNDLIEVAKSRRANKDYGLYNWIYLTDHIPKEIWRQVYSRFVIGDNDKGLQVMIGPIDRRGKKTHNSISYQYEGVIWRIMIILESLYPRSIASKGRFIFHVNKDCVEYIHLIETLKALMKHENAKLIKKIPEIKCQTKLWEHQERSVNRIFTGLTIYGKRGFGDASHVGAGKTLTALNLMVKLYNHNAKYKKLQHKGFAIMLPNTKLYKTWHDEIEKHMKGFDVIYQQANGNLTNSPDPKSKKDTVIKSINLNSLVITTMGRMRDHPIQNPWILVVIDECLTVQNKEALQTEEAWRQVCCSQYGVVMMSATFFRSRFDKMLFMIRMLSSDLPVKQEYLDTILSETMVCNITKNDRAWKINNSYHELNSKQQKEYRAILKNNSSKAYEKVYSMLVSYIHRNVDYVNIFKSELIKLEKLKRRVLIYTKSKEEADDIANSVKNVGRYPEKNKHTVVSYSEGTYGLNDLVIYDTILMRPPAPDLLPQIKGRLDRHGQKNKELYITYIVLSNTIEEASLDRLNLAQNFYKNHIMPLSEFYKLAITYK